jgi:hypothetical protein
LAISRFAAIVAVAIATDAGDINDDILFLHNVHTVSTLEGGFYMPLDMTNDPQYKPIKDAIYAYEHNLATAMDALLQLRRLARTAQIPDMLNAVEDDYGAIKLVYNKAQEYYHMLNDALPPEFNDSESKRRITYRRRR